MTPNRLLFLLLLLAGLFSAFNASEYLYPNENVSSISYLNFSINETNYSLVKIGGVDNLLLKSGEPVIDQAEMQSVLHTYYLQNYYPSAFEISELQTLIVQFNDSRNNGEGTFKNKEEYICRDDVLFSTGSKKLPTIYCRDQASCEKNAAFLFSAFGQQWGLGSPTQILGPLKNFTLSSIGMDDILANMSSKLNNLDESNVADSISYVSSNVDTVKSYSLKIESSVFRLPIPGDKASITACVGVCWGICPPFDLDQSALDSLKTKSAALALKVAPLKNFVTASSDIYSKTKGRLDHIKTENAALYYSNVFKSLNVTGSSVIAMGDLAIKHVDAPQLIPKLNKLKSLQQTIPVDLSDKNVTNIESDLNDYKNATGDVQSLASYILSGYATALDAKNNATSLVMILESKDLDPIATKTFESLKTDEQDLDVQFHDGLTLDQFATLTDKYIAFSAQAEVLVQSEGETPAAWSLLKLRGLARRINTQIANVITTTAAMPKSDIPSNPLALGSFSFVIFLSLSACLTLLFIYLFATSQFNIPKSGTLFTAAYLAGIMMVLIFSVFLHLFLTKTANSATFTEYSADLALHNSTAIVVDLRNTSFSDASAMSACGLSLAQSFDEKNKTWSLYTVSSNGCTKKTSPFAASSNMNISDCIGEAQASESLINLEYSSASQPPKFSIIYHTEADLFGGSDYYESCPLTMLFK